MSTFRSFAILVASMAFLAGDADGAVIDLRLEVDYTDASPDAGGVWRLFARTDEFGLFSLGVPLSGIDAPVTNELPVGRINGSLFDNAGFSTFVNRNVGLSRELTFAQRVVPGGTGQQGLFYGVGTLANGSPNFPGQVGGTQSLGPNLTTLASVQGVPWATEDPVWPTGVTVASGQFSPGAMPDFGASPDQFEGALFASVGVLDAPGSTINEVSFTALVVTNLGADIPADFNGDGTVDLLDLDILGANFGAGPGATREQGDANGDGNVDLLDLDLLGSTFGDSAGGTASAVPEPSSLFFVGFAALARCEGGRRRRARRAG